MSFPISLVQNKIRCIARSRALSRLLMLLVVTLGFMPTVNAAVHGFEVGTVLLPNTSTTPGMMTTVTLDQTYNNPLVFALTTNQGGDPVAIRVTNITGNTFDIAQFEPTSGFDPGDGTHRDMTISYFVIDEGIYDLPNGVIEAGRTTTAITTTVQQSPPFANTGTGFTTIDFATTFADTPTVLVDIQTDNNNALVVDSNPSPWLTTAARNADTDSIEVSLERASVDVGPDPLIIGETIGYVAIETGNYTITDTTGTDITLLALITGDVITGWDNNAGATTGVNIGFGGVDLGSDPLVVASMASRDGGDGGWLRSGTLSGTSIDLVVDEDQFDTTERAHGTESASIVGFSSSEFSFQAPTPTTLALFGLGSLLLLRLHRRKNTGGRDSILA